MNALSNPVSLIDQLIPELIPWAQKLYDLAVSAGVRPRITSGLRSYADQQSAYEAYVSGRSRYPAAKPGTSAHEYGYAFDLVVDNPVDQNDLGTVWKSWRGKWGGDFRVPDPIHFEFPGFVSPTGPTDPSAPADPISTSIRNKAERLADQVIWLLPIPLRGILSISALATQILSIVGLDEPTLDWLLLHPAEAADALGDIIWGISRASLGI